MRILTLNANLRGVGTYQRCFYFSRELVRAGHEVTMVTVSRHSRYRSIRSYKRDWVGEFPRPKGAGPWVRMVEAPNLGYKWLPGWGSGPLDIFLRSREILTGEYDAIYGFEYQPNVSWPVYLTRACRRYAFFSDWCDWYAGNSNWLRGWTWAQRVDAFFEERIRYLAKRISVISRVLAERACALRIPMERVQQIRQGADPCYCAELPRDAMRTRLGLPSDRPILGATVDGDMRRAVNILAAVRRCLPNTLLVVMGNPQRSAQERDARRRLHEAIHWAGWVSD